MEEARKIIEIGMDTSDMSLNTLKVVIFFFPWVILKLSSFLGHSEILTFQRQVSKKCIYFCRESTQLDFCFLEISRIVHMQCMYGTNYYTD